MIPPSRWTLRRRVAVELAALALGAGLYLGLLPARPLALDVAMALVGFGLVALAWKATRERIWGPPAEPGRVRLGRAIRLMLLLTVPGALALGAWGALDAPPGRPGPAALGATLLLFIPWAALQQTLLQLYLLGRLRVLWPSAPPLALAAVNGLAFGAVHLPAWDLALLTLLGGGVWSYAYQRDRLLAPLVLSHAVLGTAYLAWVRGAAPAWAELLGAIR